MKVVVCIKQVPDTKGGVKFKPDGTLDRGAMLAIMNPDDKAGLEAALRLKDQYGAEVTVLTMGLPKATVPGHRPRNSTWFADPDPVHFCGSSRYSRLLCRRPHVFRESSVPTPDPRL